MSETSECPKAPVLKKAGFLFTCGHFSVAAGDISRVDGSRLRVLFNPQSLRLKADQKEAAAAAKSLFRKPFFAGQLKHYGIKFPSSATTFTLEGLLRDSIQQGKCDQVPDSVNALKESMKRELEPLHQQYLIDAKAWSLKQKQKADAAFAKCTTPGERASYNLNRFFDYYFLTNGEPDRGKTPEPLALHGYSHTHHIHNMAERIPGLETKSGGSRNNRVVCIGWNRPAVWGLAHKVDAQDRAEQDKKREAEWEKKMQVHQRYVSATSEGDPSQRRDKKATKRKDAQTFDLGRCRGSYIIKCNAVSEGWSPDIVGELTMDIGLIKHGVLVADYHFGIIQGTMLLSQSEEQLDIVAGTGDESDEDDSDDSVGYDEDDSDSEEKPKHKRSLTQAAVASKEVDKSSGPAAKRRKMTPSVSRRVFYRLRGRETGEGEILHEPESGHLDFSNDSCTVFAGLAYYFPYIAKNVEFHGYKVSGLPKRRAKDWSGFSGAAYEYARKSRWR
ncbi:hypothetical protein FZEAL_9212 [Fusarium zealandicum]|uniref:Uncharacterized protein n=1 Tax=Fusarium zealandicum TaxID=1053134 RepID=A0A8H4XG29_9HYPO|nr:hypothetical protein FZEAL_9212 [Fusarium zealandicum]